MTENQPSQQEKKKPMIHTMKTDVNELFQDTRPTLADLVGQEVRRQPPMTRVRHTNVTKLIVWGVIGLIVLATIGVGVYFLFLRQTPTPEVFHLVAPQAPFSTEKSRTLDILANNRSLFANLMEDTAHEVEPPGIMKRVIVQIKDGPSQRFATFNDFLAFYRINPPKTLTQLISSPITPFFYYDTDGSRLGFVVSVSDANRTLASMLSWESTLYQDFLGFFITEQPRPSTIGFEDRTYRNIDWRFLKLSSDKDMGIGYGIFPASNYFIFTTSKTSFEKVIDRLFDANL